MSTTSWTRLVVAASLMVGLGAGSLRAAGEPSNNKGKIEGTKWTLQAATVKGTKVPAGTLKLDFGKNGSLVYTAGRTVLKGTYTLGAGNQVTFKVTTPEKKEQTLQETITIKGNTLTMKDADGITLSFSRMK